MVALVRYVQSWNWAQATVQIMADKVLWAFLVGMALLFALDQAQSLDSLIFLGNQLVSIAPYFALAILMAGYVKASGADDLVARAFSGNPAVAVMGAALVGAISPFCSCGVIPLIASLLAAGVPLGPECLDYRPRPFWEPLEEIVL